MKYSITAATIELQKYYQESSLKFGGHDKHVDSFLNHKLRHTYGVLSSTYEIIAQDPYLQNLPRELKRKAEIVALWHDVGRFFQVQKDRILGNKEFEHANAGYGLLRKNFGEEYTTILLAVKFHNKISHDLLLQDEEYLQLGEDQKEEAMILTKIIRDADKLRNIQYEVFDDLEEIKKFNMQIYGITADDNTQSEVSEPVLNAIKNQIQVPYKDIKTIADSLLSEVSRIYDINYQGTKTILSHFSIVTKVIDILRLVGVEEKALRYISKNFIVNRQ